MARRKGTDRNDTDPFSTTICSVWALLNPGRSWESGSLPAPAAALQPSSPAWPLPFLLTGARQLSYTALPLACRPVYSPLLAVHPSVRSPIPV